MDEGEVQAAVAENAKFRGNLWYENSWRDRILESSVLWEKGKERRGGWFFKFNLLIQND